MELRYWTTILSRSYENRIMDFYSSTPSIQGKIARVSVRWPSLPTNLVPVAKTSSRIRTKTNLLKTRSRGYYLQFGDRHAKMSLATCTYIKLVLQSRYQTASYNWDKPTSSSGRPRPDYRPVRNNVVRIYYKNLGVITAVLLSLNTISLCPDNWIRIKRYYLLSIVTNYRHAESQLPQFQ